MPYVIVQSGQRLFHTETHIKRSSCQSVDQHIFIDFSGIVGGKNTYLASPSVSCKNPFISSLILILQIPLTLVITKVISSLTWLSFNKGLMCGYQMSDSGLSPGDKEANI